MRRSRQPTTGEMRQERADNARDQKREGSMCAFGLCTRTPSETAPDDWSGPYGGRELCSEHYDAVATKQEENDG